MNKTLHIIMPMAGEGSRFLNVGVYTPKPLICANGIPFYTRALNSIVSVMSADVNMKITYIVRQEHIDKYHINNFLNKSFPTIEKHIVSVPRTTRGAVETCLLAKPYITENDAVVVMDCDLQWHASEYCNAIQKVLSGEDTTTEGILMSFHSSEPKYSYAKATWNGIVTETAEKNPISVHALHGVYFFSNGLDFVRVAHKLIDENEVSSVKEYYVSLLYNYLIREHKIVRLYDVESSASFGTPEELKRFEENDYKEFVNSL